MLTFKVKMGIHRFTKVIENNGNAIRFKNDLRLQNIISAIKLLEKTGGWSNDQGLKNRLPGDLDRGPYQTGELHCCFYGIYDSPATNDNVAANRQWEGINSDIKFERWDAVGYVDFVEAFATPDIATAADRIKGLLYNIIQEFGSFDRFTGTNLKFYIGAEYDSKALLQDAMQAVDTSWSTLTQAQKDFYTALGFGELLWDARNPNLNDLLINGLCAGSEDNLIFNKLVPPTP